MATSRRNFLIGAASSALVGGAAGFARAAEADLDVAIIGGGVSGAYTGWRLAMSPGWKDKRIEIFELSDRIGGRLFSPTMPGMPHLHAELGGMRYVVTKDASTVTERLIDHLGFDTGPAPVGGSQNLYYLRRTRFRASEITDPAIIPYRLPKPVAGKTPDQILLGLVESMEPNAASLSADQWLALKKTGIFHDRPWTESSLVELLVQPLRQGSRTFDMHETYEFLRDTIGYYSVIWPWNLAEALPWVVEDFVNTQGYRTIRAGMQALPVELADRFQRGGGRVAHGMRLTRIDQTPDGTYGLTFFSGNEGKLVHLTAAHVVLALPPRSIELLDPASVMFQAPAFEADLGAVNGHAMTKLFMGFERPWWRDSPLGIKGGRSVTDLPIRQTYYFGTEGEQPGADPTNRRSLLMTSYDDGSAFEFWNSFPKGDPIGGGPFWKLAPETVAEAQRQLSVLHGVPVPPLYDPGATLMSNWGSDPYGGAFHTWRVGQKSWEVMPRIRKPTAGKLFICGEAWSTDQGWINGALQTAEHILQDEFGLSQPDWLPAPVPLGV